MSYVAIINVPGYLPMDDDPPVFDTAVEAWEYLADERVRHEDEMEMVEYSETVSRLRELAEEAKSHPRWSCGVIYGDTPGYDGDHDLGLAYSVEPLAVNDPRVTCCGRDAANCDCGEVWVEVGRPS